MSQLGVRKRLSAPGFLSMGIIGLTVLTALLHLYLAIGLFWVMANGAAPGGYSSAGLLMFAALFILNCIGYVVLLAALYLPLFRRFQRLARWLLIGYTALTILLWYILASSGADMMAYSDKVGEGVLIVLLLIEDWQTRRHTA